MDLMSVCPQAKTEVNIFETVAESRIKASGFIEDVSAHEHAGTGNDLEPARLAHGRMIGRKARIDVAWLAIVANGHARVLNGVVERQGFAQGGGRARKIEQALHGGLRAPAGLLDGLGRFACRVSFRQSLEQNLGFANDGGERVAARLFRSPL